MSLSHISHAAFRHAIAGALLEFGPILLFLISFHYLHIYKATLALMVATIVSTILTYRIQKRLPYVALYVAMITIVFGYMTIAHHAPRFIQMRDTLYDVTLAITLLAGLIFNIQFLKIAFDSVLPMSNRAWQSLTYLWVGFFLFGAAVNEYVRRHYPLPVWFEFKWIMVVATVIFGITTLVSVYEKKPQ